MSFIQNLFSSRDNNVDVNTYVGQTDRLWYDPTTNTLRISDGSTPGGLPIDLSINANAVINTLTANTVTINTITSSDGNIAVTGNLVISGNISPATDIRIGGVKAGPGANISNDGTLTINTAGLAFSFGDFTANTNILTLVNVDQDMILATQGNAEIQLVGNIGFYKSNGLPPDPNNQFFFARDDGQIRIFVPSEDPLEGGVEIIGSATGNFITPGAPGTMLQLTGNPGIPTRLYMDGNAEYASFVARRYNGNVAAPTQVLAGQDVLRINSTAATNLGGGNVGNVAMAQIRTTALENQTATAQGSSITFTVTPVGQPATNRVDVANVTVADGITATQFTTAGNVVANTIVSAEGSGGNIFIDCNLIPTDTDCEIGSEARPWASAWFGPQSVTLLDSTGNTANTVVIENAAGNITMSTAGFDIQTLGTTDSIFRIEALTGQIFSAAKTIITDTTDAANISSGSLQTAGGAGIAKNLYVGGNISSGNVAATNYTGLVTHSIREAGTVSGGTVTLNMTTDDIVRCTFANAGMTVAFSNIIPGRTVTLLARKTDGGSDTVDTGLTAQNMSTGDETVSVDGVSTVVLTYYSLGTTTADIYCSMNYRP
jgi:hypothetical protein